MGIWISQLERVDGWDNGYHNASSMDADEEYHNGMVIHMYMHIPPPMGGGNARWGQDGMGYVIPQSRPLAEVWSVPEFRFPIRVPSER